MEHQEGHGTDGGTEVGQHQEDQHTIETEHISSDEEGTEDKTERLSIYDYDYFHQGVIQQMSDLEKEQAMHFIGLIDFCKEKDIGEIMHGMVGECLEMVGECLEIVNFANNRFGVLVKLWYSRSDRLRIERPDFFEVGGVKDAIQTRCKVEVNHLSDNEMVNRIVDRTKFRVSKAISSVKQTWIESADHHLQELEDSLEITTKAMCRTVISRTIEEKFGVLRLDVERSVSQDPDFIKQVALELKKIQDHETKC